MKMVSQLISCSRFPMNPLIICTLTFLEVFNTLWLFVGVYMVVNSVCYDDIYYMYIIFTIAAQFFLSIMPIMMLLIVLFVSLSGMVETIYYIMICKYRRIQYINLNLRFTVLFTLVISSFIGYDSANRTDFGPLQHAMLTNIDHVDNLNSLNNQDFVR